MKKAVEAARSHYRERVPLNPQAVPYSAQDALNTLVRFERLDAALQAVDHTSHDAPCLACFFEGELEAMIAGAGVDSATA